MKAYIGAKIIKAEPMSMPVFWEKYRHGKFKEKPGDLPDGYHVQYPDGYHSWSPKKVFEEAYREISDAEKGMMV